MSELVTAQGIAGDQGTPGTPGGIVSENSLFELCPLNMHGIFPRSVYYSPYALVPMSPL